MRALGILTAAAIALFLIAVLATSALALTSEEATALARDAGFDGPVVVDHEAENPNGSYSWLFNAIVLNQPAGFPDRWMAVILYHEIGHYQQALAGTLGTLESVEREWDADVRGARLGCSRGIGLEEIAGLWSWIYAQRGDLVSPSHGRYTYRVANVMLRTGAPCGRAEAPFLAPSRT